MSDQCYFRCSVKKQDFKRFSEVLGIPESEWSIRENNSFYVELEDHQASFGYYDEMVLAAKEGIIFFGYHTAGDSYTSHMFCAIDGKYYELQTDKDNRPVVAFNLEQNCIYSEVSQSLSENHEAN